MIYKNRKGGGIIKELIRKVEQDTEVLILKKEKEEEERKTQDIIIGDN